MDLTTLLERVGDGNKDYSVISEHKEGNDKSVYEITTTGDCIYDDGHYVIFDKMGTNDRFSIPINEIKSIDEQEEESYLIIMNSGSMVALATI